MNIVGVQPLPAARIAVADMCPYPVAELLKTAEICIKPFQTKKAAKRGHLAEIASRQCVCRGVFAQPRPTADMA